MIRRATWAQLLLFSVALAVLATVSAHSSRADAVAYLVNVTVRPGYNFPSGDAALAYGHAICDRIRDGKTYTQVVGAIGLDIGSPDEYQASYLVTQAVNELCPELIWQLRNTAAKYSPPSPSHPGEVEG